MTRNAIERIALRELIGRRVRELREAAGARQEDVAAAAQLHGLAWSRTKITNLEQGTKAIPTEEFLVLPGVLTMALRRHENPVTYAELFASDVEIALTTTVHPAARDLPAHLADDRSNVFGGIDVDRALLPSRYTREDDESEWAEQRARELRLRRVASADVLREIKRTSTETETRVATQLGEPLRVCRAIYAHLWGRSLSAERDARAAVDVEPDASPRSIQAKRGRVTRDLVSEVETFIRSRATTEGRG